LGQLNILLLYYNILYYYIILILYYIICSAKVNNERSYTSNPSYAFMAWVEILPLHLPLPLFLKRIHDVGFTLNKPLMVLH
jgi:hypothetical protein